MFCVCIHPHRLSSIVCHGGHVQSTPNGTGVAVTIAVPDIETRPFLLEAVDVMTALPERVALPFLFNAVVVTTELPERVALPFLFNAVAVICPRVDNVADANLAPDAPLAVAVMTALPDSKANAALPGF